MNTPFTGTELKIYIKLEDRFSNKITEAGKETDEYRGKVMRLAAEQRNAAIEIDGTTESILGQNNQAIKTMQAISALRTSVANVTENLTEMGLVTDENAARMRSLTSAVQTMVGVAQGFRLIKALSAGLEASQKKLAIIETFRAVMQNPWKAALIGLGVGAAAGAAAGFMMLGGGNTTNTTNNIIIENTPDNIQTGTSMFAVIGGRL